MGRKYGNIFPEPKLHWLAARSCLKFSLDMTFPSFIPKTFLDEWGWLILFSKHIWWRLMCFQRDPHYLISQWPSLDPVTFFASWFHCHSCKQSSSTAKLEAMLSNCQHSQWTTVNSAASEVQCILPQSSYLHLWNTESSEGNEVRDGLKQ